MKVIITSGTGGTGKTTLMVQLIYERMGRPALFAIETLNETARLYGLDVQVLSSDKWLSVQRQAMLLDDLLIEIGSTHTEGSYTSLDKLDGEHAEFDYFVVPVIPTAKALEETASTIAGLERIGIEPNRIRLLFNKVNRDVEEEFRPLLAYVRKAQNCVANVSAAVFENEIFDMAHDQRVTLSSLLADNRDFRALAREIGPEGNLKLRSQYANMHLMRSLARGIQPKLDQAYEALFS